MRLCWKALAKHPAKLSLAQKQILADTYINETADNFTPQTKPDRNQPDPTPEPEQIGQNQKTANKQLRIGTFNVRGMNFMSARQQIIYIMQKHQLDILALLETHVNYTGKEHCGSFTFYFSSRVEDDLRNKTEDELRVYNAKVKVDKISHDIAQRERMRIRQRSAEKLGCAFVVRHQPNLPINVQAIDNKNMYLQICTLPIPINLIATHVPHAGHHLAEKSRHYDELSRQIASWQNHELHLVVGDFNARLLERLPEESHIVGRHIYRHNTSSVDDLSEQQKQNRHLFADFCCAHKLLPINTWFEKPTPTLATYRDTTTTQFNLGGTDTQTHSQMDFILINDAWKNSITNVEHVHETILDSDHALIIADMRIRFARKNGQKQHHAHIPKFYSPSPVELQQYNAIVQKHIEMEKRNGMWTANSAFANLADVLISAGKATLHSKPKQQKKDYISLETWQKIEEKQQALQDGQFEYAKQLTRTIRSLARRDKEQATLQELEAIDRDGYKWDGLKRARKTFQPRRYKFKNKYGEYISEKAFPETAADYFAEVQWAAPVDSQLDQQKENTPLITGDSPMDDNPFTFLEFDTVLKGLKNNKAPGPDGCCSELIKWLSDQNKHYFLELYNDIIFCLPVHTLSVSNMLT